MINKNDLKELALQMKIPIITDEGLLLLISLIKQNNIKNILEIGTGIGYSAVMLEDYVKSVITIEKNIYLYKIAKMNIEKFSIGKVKIINDDALKVDLKGQFDLIFIDAAKAQYEKFFMKFKNYLSIDGIIVCDNLNFHHLNPENVSKNTKALLKKINNFKEFLKSNNEFKTTFLNDGDGMSISRRNK